MVSTEGFHLTATYHHQINFLLVFTCQVYC